MMPSLDVHPEVREAISRGAPVVALESTLITHGLPYPTNLAVAHAMEDEVREGGAVPATIAILGGRVTVGLTRDQIAYLAEARNVRKCSRRDFATAVARREDGATTVAGTMMVAAWVGIPVFATGGIGGVHRGQPFDVSADLDELGRTRVLVVCAGAKAILDLPLTLEALETRGVAVVGYGVNAFPAFYERTSGLPVDVRCDSPGEIAELWRAHCALELPGGLLVTVPVPEADALPSERAERAIAQALEEAAARGVRGKETTPFLLGRVSELTGQASLKANISLLKNNARHAALFAATIAGEQG